MTRALLSAAFVSSLLLAGCSDDPNQTGELEDPPDLAPSRTEQAFGEASCATAPPNERFVGYFEWTSPRLYDDPACRHSVVVDAFQAPARARTEVLWAEAIPKTREECALLKLESRLYRRVGSAWTLVTPAPRSDQGTWKDGRCEAPSVDFSDVNPGATYRIVATAGHRVRAAATAAVKVRHIPCDRFGGEGC